MHGLKCCSVLYLIHSYSWKILRMIKNLCIRMSWVFIIPKRWQESSDSSGSWSPKAKTLEWFHALFLGYRLAVVVLQDPGISGKHVQWFTCFHIVLTCVFYMSIYVNIIIYIYIHIILWYTLYVHICIESQHFWALSMISKCSRVHSSSLMWWVFLRIEYTGWWFQICAVGSTCSNHSWSHHV